MSTPLQDRLQEVRCDREPFTPDHAGCICRLTNEAAVEIERLRQQLGELAAAVAIEVDAKPGFGGYLLARLSDARKLLNG